MKLAAIYGRYSSDMQREESIEAQLRACNEYAERNDLTVIAEYTDRAKSATTDQRPEFQQMIADAKAGKFQYIIIHKLDRFSRDRYDHAFYKRELKQAGVTLISVLERIDNSPESVIMESVLEGFSEYYSRNLSREVMKGLRENALACRHTGGIPPLGYDVDSDGHYIINEKEADAVRYLFNAYLDGQGYTKMAEWLKLHGIVGKRSKKPIAINSIHDILQNEKYTGVFVFNKSASKDAMGRRNGHKKKDDSEIIRIEGGTPQIISKELFNQVQEKMKKNKSGAHRATEPYILSGVIFCGKCGAAMVGSSRGKTKYTESSRYYECNASKRTRSCNMGVVNKIKIEPAIISYLENLISKSSINSIATWLVKDAAIFIKKSHDELKTLKRELSATEKEVDRLLNLILDGLDSPAARQRLKDAESKKLLLEVKITDLEIAQESAAPLNKENITKYLSQLQGLHARTKEEQKVIISQFVKRIEVIPNDDKQGWTVTIETNLDKLKKLKSPPNNDEDLRIVMAESNRNLIHPQKSLFWIKTELVVNRK